jgi:curli biogenesis system outer membrane secretion channel CsgG
MKNIPAILACFVLCGCIPSSIQKSTTIKPTEGVVIPSQVQRIAVVEFNDKRNVKSSFPNPAPELQEKIINGLVMKKINVIERKHLNKILEEQALGQTGLIDESTAIKVGNILGVHAILIGEVLDYGKVITPVAKLDFFCRLVDVKSGKILFALQVNARKTNMNYPFELHKEVIEEAAEKILDAIKN